MYSVICTGVFFLLAIISLADSQYVYGQASTNSSGTGGPHSISGRIYLPSGRVLENSIVVELQSTAHPKATVYTDQNGSFSFTGLSSGSYTVVINAGELFEIVRESLFIDREFQGAVKIAPIPRNLTVPIYLQEKRRSSLGRAEVVNATLLAAPKAAADLYVKAQISINKGETAKAMVELREALEIHHAFSPAWNDLGVLLEKSGDNKRALDAFRAAVKFDPESFAALLNLGSALARSTQPLEAEKYLTAALTKNFDSFRGHFYMGVAETKLGRFDIAEQAFLQAIKLGGDQTSKAHYLLAGVYWSTKQYAQAADELEKYLHLEPSAKDEIKIRRSIAELRKK